MSSDDPIMPNPITRGTPNAQATTNTLATPSQSYVPYGALNTQSENGNVANLHFNKGVNQQPSQQTGSNPGAQNIVTAIVSPNNSEQIKSSIKIRNMTARQNSVVDPSVQSQSAQMMQKQPLNYVAYVANNSNSNIQAIVNDTSNTPKTMVVNNIVDAVSDPIMQQKNNYTVIIGNLPIANTHPLSFAATSMAGDQTNEIAKTASSQPNVTQTQNVPNIPVNAGNTTQ
jgi:hypothetical protein